MFSDFDTQLQVEDLPYFNEEEEYYTNLYSDVYEDFINIED